MRASGPATLFLTAVLLAGCSGGDGSDRTDSSSDPASPSAAETSQEIPQPTGVLVDRPKYSFYLPTSWEDITEDLAYVPDENTAYARETSSAINSGTVLIDYAVDAPYETFEQNAEAIVESYSTENPRIARVEDTEWTDVPSLHAVGPGSDKGTTFQGFYMIRGNDSVELQVQTPGGTRANQKVVDQIESTWEWK